VATSTQYAEYIAGGSTGKEGVWLRMVLEDLGVHQSRPTVIHADSQSALKLMENPIVNGRTKHINVTYHYVREQIGNKELKFVFVPTDQIGQREGCLFSRTARCQVTLWSSGSIELDAQSSHFLLTSCPLALCKAL
jgi:hypothetical protein